MSAKNKTYLLVSPDFPPPFIGGSLVYMHNLINNSKLDFDVLTTSGNRCDQENIRFIESSYIVGSNDPGSVRLLKMYAYLVLNLMRMKQYEVVVLNVSTVGNGLLARCLRWLGVKTVVMAYAEEITTVLRKKGFRGKIKNWLLSFYRYADQIVSVSNFAKNLLINEVGVGCSIVVIPTPLHDTKLSGDDNLAHVKKKNQILTVGRLIRRKGFIHVVNAFKKVIRVMPDATLVIVGDGDDYALLLSAIEVHGLGDSVIIYRNIDDRLLASLYSSSDIFVLANLMLENGDCEGAPNVIVEAASFGLPVIAGIEGGTSDVVNNGMTGFLIDPSNEEELSNTILRLLLDSDLYESLSQASIEKVKNEHDKKKSGIEFGRVIERMCS